jgi:hypothetical protein
MDVKEKGMWWGRKRGGRGCSEIAVFVRPLLCNQLSTLPTGDKARSPRSSPRLFYLPASQRNTQTHRGEHDALPRLCLSLRRIGESALRLGRPINIPPGNRKTDHRRRASHQAPAESRSAPPKHSSVLLRGDGPEHPPSTPRPLRIHSLPAATAK